MAITIASIKKAKTLSIINQLMMNTDTLGYTVMISKIKDILISNDRLLRELETRLNDFKDKPCNS